MKNLVSNEPVAVGAAIVALVQAVMVVATVFGWVDLSPDQQAAVMGAVTAALSLIGGVLVRRKVTPTGKE